jgi:drug/metabolite transporter (DMT)-like permease
MVIFLALCVAAVWGAADFCGGLSSRRTTTLTVLAIGYSAGSLAIVAVALTSEQQWPTLANSVISGIGGLTGLAGVYLLYRGLARGPMHIVGPVSAGSAAGLPVIWDLALGRTPSLLVLVGLAVTIVAIIVLGLMSGDHEPGDHEPDDHEPGGGEIAQPVSGRSNPVAPLSGLMYGLGAGTGFAGYFITIGETPGSQNLTCPAVARLSCLPILIALVVWRRPPRPGRSVLGLIVLGGLLDVSANALYAIAVSKGSTGVSSVISSLYPVGTIVLATVFLHEHIQRRQWLGLFAAAIGVSLVAIG